MRNDLDELNQRFGIPGLRFESGAGGLTRAVIDSPTARGELYLQGAHATHYQPTGHRPVLWMSQHSFMELGKPIRGGVPLCFPWFGANATQPQLPAHGLARTTVWNLVASSRLADGGIALELAVTMAGFALTYRASFGKSLQLALSVELIPGATAAQTFEEALHTYFAVGDVRQIAIEGLEAFAYLDKVGEGSRQPASQAAIRFSDETDRIYFDTNATCTLRDPSLNRAISVGQAGARSTVVWNPWIAKSCRMPDFGDDEWTGMVCIETANVGHQAVTLHPGQVHTLIARIDTAHASVR